MTLCKNNILSSELLYEYEVSSHSHVLKVVTHPRYHILVSLEIHLRNIIFCVDMRPKSTYPSANAVHAGTIQWHDVNSRSMIPQLALLLGLGSRFDDPFSIA